MLRRRTEDATRARLSRWGALQKTVREIVPEDLQPFLDPIKEQPEHHPSYRAWLHIGELAPIGIRLVWNESYKNWSQGYWVSEGRCGRYAIPPYLGAPESMWEHAESIDEAIARAYELGLHYPLPPLAGALDLPEKEGWITRLARKWLPRRWSGLGME